jgi:hypothetical protein
MQKKIKNKTYKYFARLIKKLINSLKSKYYSKRTMQTKTEINHPLIKK